MNYEKLAPWQVSQLVHNHEVCNNEFHVTFENGKCQWQYKDKSMSQEVFEFTMNEAKGKVKPYSSDINHAWPIITRERLTTTPYDDETQGWSSTFDTLFFVDNDDPVLASMICFLIKKDKGL